MNSSAFYQNGASVSCNQHVIATEQVCARLADRYSMQGCYGLKVKGRWDQGGNERVKPPGLTLLSLETMELRSRC